MACLQPVQWQFCPFFFLWLIRLGKYSAHVVAVTITYKTRVKLRRLKQAFPIG